MSQFYDVNPISPDRTVWGEPFLETAWIPTQSLDQSLSLETQLSSPGFRVCAVSPAQLACAGEHCVWHYTAILQERVQVTDDDADGGAA